MRMLVAEDEPRISRFVLRGLKASGYTPTVVDDGIAALNYASSGEFDLLVLDVGLPRMGRLHRPAQPARARIDDPGSRQVELSAREYSMALMFFELPGQVLSREQLLSRVWGCDYDGASNVVDVYVGYLRRKLSAESSATARASGYRLVG